LSLRAQDVRGGFERLPWRGSAETCLPLRGLARLGIYKQALGQDTCMLGANKQEADNDSEYAGAAPACRLGLCE
jgi:hypothetical protein